MEAYASMDLRFVKKAIRKLVPAGYAAERSLRLELRNGEPELHLLPALCPPDRCMVDVGANVGIYTRAAVRHVRHVYAVEPIPRLAAALRHLYRNSNVTVLECGLSDRPGSARLFVPRIDGTSVETRASLIARNAEKQDREELTVKLETLDGLGITDVGLIKIDVEGHEQEVLDGGAGLIERDRPCAIVEAEERMRPNTVQNLFSFFARRDYDGIFVHGREIHPIAEFVVQRHQCVANAKPVDGPRTGLYVNNFVFMPKSKATSLIGALKTALVRSAAPADRSPRETSDAH